MGEAMRQVKDALGDDAIIVSTREEAGWIRITAAVEQMQQAMSEKAQIATPAPEEDEDTVIEMLTDTLLRHRVPASVSDRIISQAMTQNTGNVFDTLEKALRKVYAFDPHAGSKLQKPILLAGPPGAGKTLMAAKLAARAVLNGKKAAVITTDTTRAGGIEQLEAFLDILSLPLHQAEDAASLKSVLAGIKGVDQIVIDTGGLNPFDPQEMKTLARLIAAGDVEAALVLPAGIDAEESSEMALTFEILGITRFIPTRLDFARRLGGLLSAADKAKLMFSGASHTPQVAEGILDLDAAALAKLLLQNRPAAEKRGKP